MKISTARLGSEAGFTLFEMLVSTALVVVITSGVFSVLNPSYGTFQAQPEVADKQQRPFAQMLEQRDQIIVLAIAERAGASGGFAVAAQVVEHDATD